MGDISIIDVWTQHIAGTAPGVNPEGENVFRNYGMLDVYFHGTDLAKMIDAMDLHGVRTALMAGDNEAVAKAQNAHPGRLFGQYHANPTHIMQAVRELEHYVRQRGFVALRIEPFMWRKPPTDRAYYPLYAKAAELGPGKWVYNRGGWSYDQFADNPTPLTRAELDAAAPNNPVYLQFSRCCAFLNQKGIDAMGLATMNQPWIDKDAAGVPIFQKSSNESPPKTAKIGRPRNVANAKQSSDNGRTPGVPMGIANPKSQGTKSPTAAIARPTQLGLARQTARSAITAKPISMIDRAVHFGTPGSK